MNSKRALAGRGAEIAVGATYLLAAGLKAWDFNRFIGQILAYQIFSSTEALTVVAFTTLALETFLGLSMVLGSPWRRQVLTASAAMLLFFTGLIVYAWQVHNLKDCGCFGKVPMTPPEAIAKNLVLLALTALAWYGLEAGDKVAAPVARIKLRTLGPIVLALLVCLVAFPQVGGTFEAENDGPVAPAPELPTAAAQPADEVGVFAAYRIVPEYGDTIDLAQGDYLVALLSMTCEHCMGEVPQINDYTNQETLPRVVAICLEPEEGSMRNFQDLTGPLFPMHSVGNDMLTWAKICSGVPPQLCLVRDGVVLKTWKDKMPPSEEIVAALGEGVSEETAEAAQGAESGAL